MWTYRPGLEELPVYTVEESDWTVKLDANESPFNLPPRVAERVEDRLACLAFNRYPDLGKIGLRELLAESYGLAVEEVQVGGGSSEILAAICHALGGPGRGIVYPTPSFSMYGIYAKITDSVAVPVALNEQYQLDAAKVLQAARENNAAVILLCNPNNPTGSVTPREEIERIIAGAPCPVVADEAYMEFYGDSVVDLLPKYRHLIVARTFSKAYGLAAARVGYMLADAQVTTMISKLMMPYHVSAISLVVAETVWQMRDEFQPLIDTLVLERKRLATELAKIQDLTVYPSETNFIFGRSAKTQEMVAYLMEKRICIRNFGGELSDCFRISVGSSMENDALLREMRAFWERS